MGFFDKGIIVLKKLKIFISKSKLYIGIKKRPYLAVGITIIWNTIDWWNRGHTVHWFNDCVESPEVIVGAIISLGWYLSLLIYHAEDIKKQYANIKVTLDKFSTEDITKLQKKMDKLSTDINNFSNQLVRIEKTGISTVETCIRFLNEAFRGSVLDPDFWGEVNKKCPAGVQESINSLGANIKAWSGRIKKHSGIDKNGNPYLTNLTNIWLTYLETYLREEAFDVHRQELVTNGRNYPFMLIATLSTLVDHLADGEYLHYYATTPVNPKDWYNWPHGRNKPKCYHESNFLSLFHRSLHEFLVWTKREGSKLVHSRFILTREDNVPEGSFGWELDYFAKLTDDLNNCQIVNISAPLVSYQGNPVWSAFKNYYDELIKPFGMDDQKTYIVPLYGTHWKNRLINNNGPRIKAVKKFMDQLTDIFQQQQPMIANLDSDFAKKAAEIELEECLKNIDEKFSGPLNNLISIGKNSKNINFPEMLKNLHRTSLELTFAHIGTEDIIKRVLLALLRYRAVVFHSSKPVKFSRLGEVFARDLHSHPENAYVVKLKYSEKQTKEPSPFDIMYWIQNEPSKRIEPEFAIFGISKQATCSADTFEGVDWKLALATDISYPFETAKIHIIDDGAIKRYSNTIRQLLLGLGSANTYRLVDLLNTGGS